MNSPHESLVDFATNLKRDAVPESVYNKAKTSILDGIGTALLSSTLERSKQTIRALRSDSSDGESGVWGTRLRGSPLEAALLNGMLTEGLDYSDIHIPAGLHPTCVILPAVVSHGEAHGSSGADVLLSYVIGCESMIRLGLSASGRFHARGFQPTSIAGVLGSALATGRLLDLQAGEMTEALSLASTLAFGSTLSIRVGVYFGGIDTGRAAESGMLAAMMAKEGVPGIAKDSIDGRFGFLETYAGRGNYRLEPILDGLGKMWDLKDIFLKRYPTSFACTFMLDAAIRLRKRSKLDPSEIEEIRFGDSAANIGLFSEPEEEKRRPASIYVAKTSHYFILSLALMFGRVDAALLESKLKDKKVLQLSDKVSYALDEKSHWVEVKLKDGTVLREEQDTLDPTPEPAVRKKYLANAAPVIGEGRAKEVEEMVDGLEGLPDIRALTKKLSQRQR